MILLKQLFLTLAILVPEITALATMDHRDKAEQGAAESAGTCSSNSSESRINLL